MSDPAVFTIQIESAPEVVYRHLTQEVLLTRWLCDDSKFQARVGGYYLLGWYDGYFTTGTVTALEKGRVLSLSWEGKDEAPSRVDINLSGDDGRTTVEVVHHEPPAKARKAWPPSLEGLKTLVEQGHDLRIASRPLLGISANALADMEAKGSVPVSEGLYLDGVVEGLGAYGSGLRTGDVIVSLGGQPVADFRTLQMAVSPFRGGDSVEVEFYRGAEKQTVTMTLSKRPMPDATMSPSTVAEFAQTNYAELASALEQIIAGVPEEILQRRPAPGEWSAHEVIAHLIWTERWTQMCLWHLAAGLGEIEFPNNDDVQRAGIRAVYPTSGELVKAFAQAQDETTAMILALTPELVKTNRGAYASIVMAHTHPGATDHQKEHLEQIRAAITAAGQPV